MNAISQRPRRGCVWLLALGLVVLYVLLVVLSVALDDSAWNAIYLESVIAGAVVAMETLLPCWLTWGGGRFLRRMAAVLLISAVANTAVSLLALSNRGQVVQWIILSLLLQQLIFVFTAHAAMMPAQLLTKWDLRFCDHVPTIKTFTRQWSLLDFFAWSMMAALPFAFMKLSEPLYAQRLDHDYWVWVAWQLKQLLHVALTCTALYAVFVVEHSWRRRAMIVIAVAIADMAARLAIAVWLNHPIPAAGHMLVTLAALATAYIVGCLLRSCGVVLYRPSANEAALTQAVAGGNSTSASI